MLTSRTASAFQADKHRQATSPQSSVRRSGSNEADGLGRKVAVAVAVGAAALVLLGAGSSETGDVSENPAGDVGNHPIVDIAPVGEPGEANELRGGKGRPLTVE